MADRVYNVLFLCTGNSARSILAESLLRSDVSGCFRAFSAGSQPKGVVNPMASKVLARAGLPTDGLSSKSWDAFAEGPLMDFVFTVCDQAAGESCPIWPGQPMTAHWGIGDPAAVVGSEIDKERAFVTALRYLKTRISLFTSLPLKSLDAMTLRSRLVEIGQSEGASSKKTEHRVMDVFIYHNPDCGTSRNTLAMIRNAGVEPHVVEYLKTPPTRAMLQSLIARMGVGPRDLLREKGMPYADLGLGDPAQTDDHIIDAMLAHPLLINRPIVVTPNGVRLCRPSEAVLDLLPPQRGEFVKEDGERVVDERGRPVRSA